MTEDEEKNLTIVDVKDLRLDKKNFRIDFSRVKNEHDIEKLLFGEEEIMEMAQSIVSANGLYPHESLIATKEDGKNIVLEGNRRVLAIRCLLDPSLVPLEYRGEFEKKIGNISEDLKKNISKVNVVFMNREDALKIVADKHSDISYKKWSLLSQWRFIRDQYRNLGLDINKTIDFLSPERPTDVSNGIKFINLIEYVRGLKFWDEQELRAEIEKNRLEPTRLTRALGYTEVINSLNLSFNGRFEVVTKTGVDKEAFDWVLFNFTKSALIDSEEWAKINTRSSKEEIVRLIKSWYDDYSRTHPNVATNKDSNQEIPENGGKGPGTQQKEEKKGTPHNGDSKMPEQNKPRAKNKKPSVYFEDLTCNIGNNRLIELSTELKALSNLKYKNNNVEKLPAAAVMLIRALLESSLYYKIDNRGKLTDYKKWISKNRQNGSSYETLNGLVSYAIDHADEIFKKEYADKAKSVLNQVHRNDLDYMNSIVHGNWQDPTPERIQTLAGNLRELFNKILSGEV